MNFSCECNVPDNREPQRHKPLYQSKARVRPLLLLAAVLFSAPEAWRLPFALASAGPQQHNLMKPKEPPKELPVSFSVGEVLTYRVSWSAFSNAASLQLSVPERRDLFGSQTWHFRGVAHTLSPVRTLFEIDDQFDSYSDAATLDSRQFETHLNEMGKQTDQIQRLAAGAQSSRLPAPVVVVPQDTRDALGVVYALRGVDWQRSPEFRAPVYDGKDVFEVRATREGADETVKVAAGSYFASRIALRVFQYQKELSNVHYVMWIASDAPHTPVAMEADLPFGNIRAELTSVTH